MIYDKTKHEPIIIRLNANEKAQVITVTIDNL